MATLAVASPTATASDGKAKPQPASKTAPAKMEKKSERAIFAAGCFWKVQYQFSRVPGVIRTRAGYSGGKTQKPSYKEVCTDKTGHAEVVEIEFDPNKVTYGKLLRMFFTNHNPTTLNRQGLDVGTQYRSAIFCTTTSQKAQALAFKKQLEDEHRYPAPIVTVIEDALPFFAAEDYHQDYFKKHGAVCN